MATVIGDLLVQLGLDIGDFRRELDDAGDRVEKFGNHMFFLGARITAGVTVPITGAVAVLGKLGMEFDHAMTESLAIADASSKAIRDTFEDMAMSVSETMTFTAEEGAKGFYPLISAGLKGQEALEGLPVVARFAQAGVMDLAKATEYLAGAEASMGRNMEEGRDKVERMAHIADVLTEANNRAIGTVQDFAAALSNRAGAALSQFGKDVEEGVAVLAIFAEQNIRGKSAGQQLWMVMRDLSTYALRNADQFKRFGIAVFDAGGNMRNLADIIEDIERATENMTDAQQTQMFNLLQIPLRSVAATKALIGYSAEIKNHEAALRSAGGVTQRVAEFQMTSLTNQLQVLKNQFSNTAITIFQQFVPVIQDTLIPMAKSALEAFRNLGEWIENLDPGTKKILLTFVALAAAIGPVIAALGSAALAVRALMMGVSLILGPIGGLAGTVGKLISPLSAATANTTAFGAAMGIIFSPITLAIGALGALGIAFYKWKTSVSEGEAAIRAYADQARSNAKDFRQQSQDFQGLLNIWDQLRDQANLTAAEEYQLKIATEELAKASGLSVEAFTREARASEDLASSLWDQVDARKAALQEAQRGAMGAEVAASNELARLEARLAAVQSGKATKKTFISNMAGGFVAEEKLTAAERVKEIQRLTGAITGAEQKLKDARAAYNDLLGVSRGAENDPILGGGRMKPRPYDEEGMPENVKALTGDKKKIDEVRLSLLSVNKELTFLKQAWDMLTPAQQQNETVLDNLWKAYSKLAEETGILVPEFDRLFQSQWKQRDMAIELANAGKNWFDTWSDGLVQLDKDSGDILMTMGNLTAPEQNAFWKQHAGVVEEALGVYNQVKPTTQALVEKYLRWKIAVRDVGSEMEQMGKATKENMSKLLEDTSAKLKDMQENIRMFGANAGAQHRRAVRTQLAQITQDQEQELKKQIRLTSTLKQEEILPHLEFIRRLKQEYADYNAAYQTHLNQQYAASIGVAAKILKVFHTLSHDMQQAAIEAQLAWNEMMVRIAKAADNLRTYGDIFSVLGLEKMGAVLQEVSGHVTEFAEGMEQFRNAEHLGEYIAAFAKMATAAIKAYKSISQLETRGQRTASMAMAGMEMGGAIMPGWGHVIGLGVGALVGAMMDDPAWAKAKKKVAEMWRVNISEELANQIAEDQERLGSQMAGIMVNMAEVMEEEGLSVNNLNRWGFNAAGIFTQLEAGTIDATQAAEEMDQMFGQLVETGTTANGFLNDQVRQLIVLERQYQTGSQAIRDYQRAQLDMVATGLNKIAGASLGLNMEDVDAMLGFGEKQKTQMDKILELRKEIQEEYDKDVRSESDIYRLVALRLKLAEEERIYRAEDAAEASRRAQIDRMMGPGGQEEFDRLGRLGAATFDAMLASGRPVSEILEAMGPTIDRLAVAQQMFGFQSSAAVDQLMRFRDFATVHPELVEQLDGVNLMLQGLHNTSFLTQETFADLGSVASDTYQKMIDGGMSSDEAMQFMQPTLQRLWELQQKFGYEVDETTQAMLDEAEASGRIGQQFMSAQDRMVLGIETLVDRLGLLLEALGIQLPDTMRDAADTMISENDRAMSILARRYRDFKPSFDISYSFEAENEPPTSDTPRPEAPEPIPMARGGIFTRPVVAGEAGPEAFVPLDTLWDQMDRMVNARAWDAAEAAAGGGMTVVVVSGQGTPQEVADRVLQQLPRKVRLNDRGLRTELIDALQLRE